MFDIPLNSYISYELRGVPNIRCNNREIPHATLRILLCNFRYFYYAINTIRGAYFLGPDHFMIVSTEENIVNESEVRYKVLYGYDMYVDSCRLIKYSRTIRKTDIFATIERCCINCWQAEK